MPLKETSINEMPLMKSIYTKMPFDKLGID
jgi:hypothetical protein